MSHNSGIGAAIVLVLLVGPAALAITGAWATSRMSLESLGKSGSRRAPRLGLASALLYVFTFNIIFLLQELFLVIPKALTPGLRPTLFHNNHTWEGSHALADLFQGTGALAILLAGVICVVLATRERAATTLGRLCLIWLAYNGMCQAAPQFVVGAMGQGDVAAALDYLEAGPGSRLLLALVALALIPATAFLLERPLLSLATASGDVAGPADRTRFVFRVMTLPALLSIPLIVAFRIPREPFEVLFPPVVSTFVGLAWMQSAAWMMRPPRVESAEVRSLAVPVAAVLGLLLLFQVVLRPGVRFF